MRFNKGERRVLHLERNNCVHQCRLRAELLERGSVEKDLGVLVGNGLTVSQPLWPRMPVVSLGYTEKRMASKSRQVILPFYPALMNNSIWSIVSSSGLLNSRKTGNF